MKRWALCSVLKAERAKKTMVSSQIRAWNLVLSRAFLETFFVQGRSRKILSRKNSRKAWAPRSDSSAKRGSKTDGTLLDSRCFVGTLFFPGRFRQIFCGRILAKHGRHAAFHARGGEAKTMVSCWIRAVSLEPCSFEGVFGKIFDAAFQARSGEAKTMVSCWIRAVSLEPCSFKGVFGKFFAEKFLQSMGATQRFWLKKNSRELPLVLCVKNHRVGWGTFSIYFSCPVCLPFLRLTLFVLLYLLQLPELQTAVLWPQLEASLA